MTRARLFRLVVAVGLTAYVLWKSAPSRVLSAAADADLTWIGLACGLVVIDRVLMAYRWWILLCAIDEGQRPGAAVVLRIFFISTFVGTFLPSAGGDLYRAYSLARHDVRGAEAASSVLMDRVLGVVSILLMSAGGLLVVTSLASNRSIVMSLVIGTIACGFALAAVFSERVAAACSRVAARVPVARVQRIGGDLIAAIRRFSQFRGELGAVLALSVAVQVLRILQAFCLGRALGIALPLVAYFALVPTILLIMLLPVTVNGLGTGQLAFVGLFGELGVPRPDAFALSILFIALGILGNLPGAILYARGERTRQSP